MFYQVVFCCLLGPLCWIFISSLLVLRLLSYSHFTNFLLSLLLSSDSLTFHVFISSPPYCYPIYLLSNLVTIASLSLKFNSCWENLAELFQSNQIKCRDRDILLYKIKQQVKRVPQEALHYLEVGIQSTIRHRPNFFLFQKQGFSLSGLPQ